VPLLLPNLGPEYRPATVGPTRRNSAVAPEAKARSHAALWRTHPRADAPSGLVIAHHIPENLGKFVPINDYTGVGLLLSGVAPKSRRSNRAESLLHYFRVRRDPGTLAKVLGMAMYLAFRFCGEVR